MKGGARNELVLHAPVRKDQSSQADIDGTLQDVEESKTEGKDGDVDGIQKVAPVNRSHGME